MCLIIFIILKVVKPSFNLPKIIIHHTSLFLVLFPVAIDILSYILEYFILSYRIKQVIEASLSH